VPPAAGPGARTPPSRAARPARCVGCGGLLLGPFGDVPLDGVGGVGHVLEGGEPLAPDEQGDGLLGGLRRPLPEQVDAAGVEGHEPIERLDEDRQVLRVDLELLASLHHRQLLAEGLGGRQELLARAGAVVERVREASGRVERVGVLPAVEVGRAELQLQGVLGGAQAGVDDADSVGLVAQAREAHHDDGDQEQADQPERTREALADPPVLQPHAAPAWSVGGRRAASTA
jgi:hypothetical protein